MTTMAEVIDMVDGDQVNEKSLSTLSFGSHNHHHGCLEALDLACYLRAALIRRDGK